MRLALANRNGTVHHKTEQEAQKRMGLMSFLCALCFLFVLLVAGSRSRWAKHIAHLKKDQDFSANLHKGPVAWLGRIKTSDANSDHRGRTEDGQALEERSGGGEAHRHAGA